MEYYTEIKKQPKKLDLHIFLIKYIIYDKPLEESTTQKVSFLIIWELNDFERKKKICFRNVV